ncbi:MAG: SHOCT domain-containing protein [Arenicellales bacterium]|nr:SHOCT domain-containing protein [Arenicellales bacterium]
MPLFDVLWSIFVFFLLIAWIWVLIGVISDVFRSDDLNGLAKGLWVLAIIVVPWLGVLAYLIIRGQGMAERNAKAAADAEKLRREYIREVVAGPSEASTADELTKLANLKEKGVLTDAEFEAQKAKILG